MRKPSRYDFNNCIQDQKLLFFTSHRSCLGTCSKNQENGRGRENFSLPQFFLCQYMGYFAFEFFFQNHQVYFGSQTILRDDFLWKSRQNHYIVTSLSEYYKSAQWSFDFFCLLSTYFMFMSWWKAIELHFYDKTEDRWKPEYEHQMLMNVPISRLTLLKKIRFSYKLFTSLSIITTWSSVPLRTSFPSQWRYLTTKRNWNKQ